jgi:hypothetical protein
MNLYYHSLTEAEMLAMTEDQLNSMGEIYMESYFPQEWGDIILSGLRTSGPWEDFQCDLDRWNRIYNAFAGKYIHPSRFPARPTLDNYSSDLTTERSRCNYGLIIPE